MATQEPVTTREPATTRLYRYVTGAGLPRNVGGSERALRYLGGALFLVAALAVAVVRPFDPAVVAAATLLLGVSGVYLVYEARVQYCPLNHTVGRSTYRERE